VVDDNGGKLELGGTTLELLYLGKNPRRQFARHAACRRRRSSSSVDFLPLSGTQFRIMADTYLPDQEDSMKKILTMDWDRLIPGHPGAGGRQVGNKEDVKTDLDYMLDLSRRREEGDRRKQMLCGRDRRDQIAQVRESPGLRPKPSPQYRTLLRLLESRHLIAPRRRSRRRNGAATNIRDD